MNMKNNLINSRLLLLTIILNIICITLIRNFMSFKAITYTDFEKKDPTLIVTLTSYATTHLNKPAYTKSLPSNGKSLPANGRQSPTLSRGSIEDVNKNSATKVASDNYEDELYSL